MPLSALSFSIWQLLMSFYFCLWISACLLPSHRRRQQIINTAPYRTRKLWTTGMTIRRGVFKPAIAEQKDLFPVQISLSLTSFNWCGLHPPKQKCEYQESVAETALSLGIGAEKEQYSPYSPLKQLSAARNYKMQTRKLKHRKMTELFTSMFSFPEDLSLIQQSSVFQLAWLRHEILKPLCTFVSFRKVLLLLRPARFRFTGGRRHPRRWLCIHTMLEL